MARYGMHTTLNGSFEEVKQKVVEALKAQGFGILSEIDVQQTLKEKIGLEMEAYQILGACNPQLASQALETDRSIGLLLPCNVVLREVADGVEVSILDPEVMFTVADEATQRQLASLPQEAKARLTRALEALKEA
ncbi:DUF302 domain-containing protein [Marinithermus hydrothermalis]|uniref:DUF302 domain-containing protein n=1 Tax=Marinithermus hydrothermalis (strain DSM 14884 / JCM 11576 / T1) TaxID=869210 RepID=F2NPT0_MARHT|nr:DUF302 domain-containing protein [Marinithermus hydrothermalis]AEB12856.1 protein of unknown function DUF302 [Marinithermus hydrothermalis DSM 14884]